MKRITALFLLFALILPITGKIAAAESVWDSQKVEEIATEYLREAAYSQYLYETNDLDRYTIESIPTYQKTILAEKTARYAEIRESRERVPYMDTAIATGSLNALVSNLELNKDMVAFYAHLGESSDTAYDFFTESYEILETDLEGDFAFVDLYEDLDFKYSDVDFTSSASPHYFISLVKFNGEWLIMAIESDDIMYETYKDTGFDLQQFIEDADAARNTVADDPLPEEPESRDITSYNPTYDRMYNRANAANYALTYCKKGNMGDLIPSPWKNDYFYYGDNDCMRFVSQCMWAGFGGSNYPTNIRAYQAMDPQNENQTDKLVWFGSKTSDGQADESLSWKRVREFEHYVHHKYTVTANGEEHVYTASSGEDRMHCLTYEINGSQPELLSGNSSANNYTLLGAAVLVKQPNASLYSHAILITQVKTSTGVATRDTVYFTAYNGCYKNYKLSAVYWSGNSGYPLEVVRPEYLQNGNPGGGNYYYGVLKPTLTLGSSEMVCVKAKDTAATMEIYIYKPNASTASFHYSATNCSYYQSPYITFNQTGLWRVVVRKHVTDQTQISSFTFTIRVASSSEAGNDPEP